MAIQTETLKKQLFTVKETAAILSTSTNVIYKLLDKGDLKALRLPGIKVPDFEIERFKHWVYENNIDYSDILKKKENKHDEKVQTRSNSVDIGSIIDRIG